jgi:hypothetical protein
MITKNTITAMMKTNHPACDPLKVAALQVATPINRKAVKRAHE